jgi:release factor glutamine methyltransferase
MGLQIKEILTVGENILKEAGDSDAKLDAEILLCHHIRYDSAKIFMNWTKEVDDDACEAYFASIQKRAEGTPTQYITGVQDFMGYAIKVDERALIPRADSEVLAEEVIAYLGKTKSAKTLLELCTGTGAISIAIAKKNASIKITATDISKDALALAQENVTKLGVEGTVTLTESDLFDKLKKGFKGRKPEKYDVIVANPPYIKTADLGGLQREIKEHEPMLALDGGEDGLNFYRRIIAEAPDYLTKKNAAIFLEIGYDQAEKVMKLIEDDGHYKEAKVTKDLAGHDRVVSATLK